MIGILICLIVMAALQLTLPFWWWIMVVPFLYAALMARSTWQGFQAGFISAGVLWLMAGLYYLLTSADLIAGRVATMMQMGSPWTLLVVASLLAALAGGFAGGAGHALKGVLQQRRRHHSVV